MRKTFDSRPWLWLLAGTVLLFACQLRFGIGALAWLAPVPFLRALRITHGWKSRIAFACWFALAWNLAVAKIVTAPVPWAMAPLFALPVAVLLGAPYLLWAWARERIGEVRAGVLFATASVVGEWLLHAALPLGTWGATANTQVERLALLQLASVTGLHGVSFLVDLFAVALEGLLDGVVTARVRFGAVALGLVIAAMVWGEARLVCADGAAHPTHRVAAVGTDATFGGPPLPTAAELRWIDDGLERRTRIAARAGAVLVVWPEGATLVPPGEQDAWLLRVRALARDEHVAIVAAYIVPLSMAPLRFDNLYVWIRRDGEVDHVYRKHRPVPGEPAVAGHDPAPVAVSDELGRASGAICYDYDFPALGRQRAALGVDLVALPSSDWRGIDPIHTQMAGLRAIESGHSVLRSTRLGLSAGIDPWGRVRGWLSHWDSADRVMWVDLPRHGIRTVYGTLGDWFPWSCGLATLGGVALAFRRRRT